LEALSDLEKHLILKKPIKNKVVDQEKSFLEPLILCHLCQGKSYGQNILIGFLLSLPVFSSKVAPGWDM
jgi:hypothetical protein